MNDAMSENGNGPAPVQPCPVPLSWQFGKATTDTGIPMLVMLLATPTGQTTLFFDRDAAAAFFSQGSAAASGLGSSLIIPNILPPKGLP